MSCGDGFEFEGTILVKIDEKGRVRLPKSFCGSGCSGFVIVRHPDGCLVVYPPQVWESRRRALSELPHSERFLARLVLGSAHRVELDAAGRMLVPSSLRRLAGLEREAALVGLSDRFEVWNESLLRRMEQEAFASGFESSTFTF